MRASRRLLFVTVMLVAVFAITFGSVALAKGKPDPGKCRDRLIFCQDYWDPVICDDGKVYSNECYARRACATGCVPYGGPIPAE